MGSKNDKSLSAAVELRHRAEEQLLVQIREPLTDHETQRLLHELQVHQIELEMQNAELRQTRVEVETALEKYAELNEVLENRVRERTAQLQEKIRDIESFCYAVSHDLRAPLRAVDGISQIFAEKYAAIIDTEGRKLLDRVHVNMCHMGELIDDLLEFSRLGRRPVMLTTVDMGAETHTICTDLSALAPERHITFTIGELHPAGCDRAMIRQVLINLIANAIKFTAPREEALIEITSTQDENETVYRITDNGVGFDIKYADKLFGVFEQLHLPGEFEGTGVGLAIVKRVIDKHGGRVWTEAVEGRGASFFFSLPRSPQEGTEELFDWSRQ